MKPLLPVGACLIVLAAQLETSSFPKLVEALLFFTGFAF